MGFLVSNWVLCKRKATISENDVRNWAYYWSNLLLISPRNRTAISADWGVIWIYTHYELHQHCREFCEAAQVLQKVNQTDLRYHDSKLAWYLFANYTIDIPHNIYSKIEGELPKKFGMNI